MASSSPSLPRTIGRYEVARALGQGAMGRVLLAQDPVLRREVAIKVLRDDLGLSPEAREGLLVRMRHEAQAAARVSHPNLVTLHDMGEDAELGLYLVFEFVPGQNLKERLRGGRLPPMQAARLSRELGQALAVAHLAGVLHRDVKPENVMLAPTGAKLSDFGIARVPDSTLTRTGTLLGTPAYCAPEALECGAFSPESDQFSLAATLYEAVSAERAFPGDDAVGVAAKIRSDEPRPIARRLGLVDEVDVILLRGMHKDPTLRFASTAELGETLSAALERSLHAAVRAAPLALRSAGPAGGRDPAPNPTRIAIGAVTVALVSGLVGYAAAQGLPFFGMVRAIPALSAAPAAPATAPPEPVSVTHLPPAPHPPRPRPQPSPGGSPGPPRETPRDGGADPGPVRLESSVAPPAPPPPPAPPAPSP